MTIDEAIAECKENDLYQLAEWLEELKAYREVNVCEYNKAIDDFIHEGDKNCGFYSGENKNLTREDLLKIAEQLKAGGKNETVL